jgi:ATP-dependent Clp protease adaptor protein ClpS
MNQAPNPDSPAGGVGLLEETESELATDTPWQTVLRNDPVNTFAFVIASCKRILKCSQEQAELYAHRTHYEGRAVVYSGPKEQAETYAAQFSAAHLWCHAERTS